MAKFRISRNVKISYFKKCQNLVFPEMAKFRFREMQNRRTIFLEKVFPVIFWNIKCRQIS